MHPDDLKYYSDMALQHGMSIDAYIKYEKNLLPPIRNIVDYWDNPPELAQEIIKGVLRKGHKMLFTGGSKVGKSWAMIGLALALASGGEWLGNWCKRSKVLYINMEIDESSFAHRVLTVAQKKGLSKEQVDGYFHDWSLRGKSAPLAELSQKIIERAVTQKYDVIIIDPIYKVQSGDENNAGDIGKFTNELDRIATEMGSSVVYAHHHTKGAQGAKKAIDRAAGSGVFARDADAMVDVLELDEIVHPDKRAFKVEFTTREFMTPPDKYVWFEFPCFREDFRSIQNALADAKNEKRRMDEDEKAANKEKAREQFEVEVWNKLVTATSKEGNSHWSAVAEIYNTSERSVRNWVKMFPDDFEIKKGIIFKK